MKGCIDASEGPLIGNCVTNEDFEGPIFGGRGVGCQRDEHASGAGLLEQGLLTRDQGLTLDPQASLIESHPEGTAASENETDEASRRRDNKQWAGHFWGD